MMLPAIMISMLQLVQAGCPNGMGIQDGKTDCLVCAPGKVRLCALHMGVGCAEGIGISNSKTLNAFRKV